MNVKENREWIAEEYKNYYEKIKEHVCEKSTKKGGLRYFTPHDSSHCFSVEKIVKELVIKSKVELNDLENFILLSAVWTHDLGMVYEIAKDCFEKQYAENASIEKMREMHDKTASWYLKKYFKDIFGLEEKKREDETLKDIDEQSKVERYVNTINLISKYHRRKEEVDECPKKRFVENEQIRTRLLACFLRLGDTLHVDLSRYDKEFYDILQIGHFDRVARLHWFKSYVVSNIYLDDKKETIFINIDLPEFKPEDKNELEEGYEKLSFIIREDVYEDVLDVNETFREYDLTCYATVKPIINLISGYSKEDKEAIRGLINDIEVLLSPSDSKVNKKTVSSINSLCKTKFDNYEDFYNQTEQLIQHLNKIYSTRPCHVGLRKIINMLEEIFNKSFRYDMNTAKGKDIKDLQNIIMEKVNELDKESEKLREEIYGTCKKHLEGIKHIFVCGISETVSNFLEAYSKTDMGKTFKDEVNIYVLEFGGKRRFLRSNIIEYNDGSYYSLHIKKMGFKNVYLMPDTSLASLINSLKIEYFSWDEVSDDASIKNNKQLREFLEKELGIFLEENTRINKNDDEKTITITNGEKTFRFELKEKNKVILKISDVNEEKYEYNFKKENGNINVYNNGKISERNSLMLFGANGIDEYMNCGHSSGHLMAAIIAKHFRIPVKVIASAFKKGKIKWVLSAQRKGNWLTGQKNRLKELDNHNVKLINYLEDRISRDLIEVITTN